MTQSPQDALNTALTDEATALAALHQAHDPHVLAVDDDGWLRGPGITVMIAESPKRQALAAPLEHVEAVVWHYTDTRGCGAMNLAKRIASVDGRAASWHLVVDAAGDAVQSVSAKHGSWHAGGAQAALFTRSPTGAWSALAPAQRGKMRGWSANSFAFGIELENVGEVRLSDGKWCGWPFKFGTEYGAPAVVPAAEVVVSVADPTRGHHAFTPAQVHTALRVVAALVGRYGLTRAACSMGHEQIDPANRTDPGPLWLGTPTPPLDGAVKGGHLGKILDDVFDPPAPTPPR